MEGHSDLDVLSWTEALVTFSLLLSPPAAITRVEDDGGFVEARVKMQVQLVLLLAQVNGEAVNILVDLAFNFQGHP